VQTTFGHLSICVCNSEAAVQYYADHFEFKELFRMKDEKGGDVGLAALQIGDREL
jgi:uncharacterized glyoxalase superfamily protein PhnB